MATKSQRVDRIENSEFDSPKALEAKQIEKACKYFLPYFRTSETEDSSVIGYLFGHKVIIK